LIAPRLGSDYAPLQSSFEGVGHKATLWRSAFSDSIETSRKGLVAWAKGQVGLGCSTPSIVKKRIKASLKRANAEASLKASTVYLGFVPPEFMSVLARNETLAMAYEQAFLQFFCKRCCLGLKPVTIRENTEFESSRVMATTLMPSSRSPAEEAAIFSSPSSAPWSTPSSLLTVIVAAYDESIAWTVELPEWCEVLIYQKKRLMTEADLEALNRNDGGPSVRQVTPLLENVGRETHTYLTYILSRFRDTTSPGFPANMVFVQGDPFAHNPTFLKDVRGLRPRFSSPSPIPSPL
jgi:hypothetical protein